MEVEMPEIETQATYMALVDAPAGDAPTGTLL
jgi:hypothetical protein